jgi:hypothetical protein
VCSAPVRIVSAPTEAGIKQATTRQEDNENAWNGHHGIFDQHEMPMIFSRDKSSGVRNPGEKSTNMPGKKYSDEPDMPTIESVGQRVPDYNEATGHTNPNR